MSYQHKGLAADRWHTMSLVEQLGNIGSEVSRTRESFCDAMLGGKEYGTTFASLQPYFDRFALFAQSR